MLKVSRMADEETTNPHVIMLSSAGIGHLIPLIEFAKRFVHLHDDFRVTIIIPVATIGPPPDVVKPSLAALPSTIDVTHVLLPPVNFNDHPDPADMMKLAVNGCLPALRDLLNPFKEKGKAKDSVVFVADAFSMEAFDVAREYNIPSYIFFPSNALTLSLSFHLPNLIERVSPTTTSEPIKIPGCISVHGRDLPDPIQDPESRTYQWFLDTIKRFRFANGIAVNTFWDMEAGPLKALMEEKEPDLPPVYPVGPLVQEPIDDGSLESECLRWLNNQPRSSVLFVAFGSGGTLSHAQLTELAFGLEMSGQNFVWVLRTPNDESSMGAIFNNDDQRNPFDFLPEKFLVNTKQRGFVIPSWAPQAQILSHGSTGGFLTHCGWNSVLESIVSGVPLIAWPLYAEQKMNAVMLTEDVRVGLRPKMNENGLIVREEVAKVARELMKGEEGKVIRNRMKELMSASKKALAKDGSSTKAVSELALKWKSK